MCRPARCLQAGHGLVEEEAAGVGVIAHPGRHPHQPQPQGGLHGVGQGQGHVEAAPQLPEDLPFAPVRRVADDLRHSGLGGKQRGDPGGRQHGDLGQGKEPPQPRQHRQAHDRIPHPVGGAHQEAPHHFRVPGKPAGHLKLLKPLPDLGRQGQVGRRAGFYLARCQSFVRRDPIGAASSPWWRQDRSQFKTDFRRHFASTEGLKLAKESPPFFKGGQGGLNKRLIIPLNPPLGKGDLKPQFSTFHWLREHICSSKTGFALGYQSR